jgi:hypothetical protein
MLIIWGIRNINHTLAEGSFFCPHCQAPRAYQHKRARRFFTLYFLPIIPLNVVGEFVECQACKQTYQMAVLNVRPPTVESQQSSSVRTDLESGMPIHMIGQKLMLQGKSEAEAKLQIETITKGWRRICPQCRFEYLRTVKNCMNCSAELPPAEL